MDQSKQKPVPGGYEKQLEFGSTRDSMGLSSTCKSRKHKISRSEYYIELPKQSSTTTSRKHELGRSEYYIELPKQSSSSPSRKHKIGRSEYYIELPKQSSSSPNRKHKIGRSECYIELPKQSSTTTNGKRKISQSEYYIELPKQSSSSTSRERKISRSEYYIELPKKSSTRNKRKQEINRDKSNQPSTSNRTNECRDHMQPSSHKKRKQDMDTSRDHMELATELASCKKIKQETGQSPEEVELPRQEPLYSKTKHILCNVLSKASFSGFMKCVSKTWKALLPSNSLARYNNYHNAISGLVIQRQLDGIEGIPYAIMDDDSVVLSFPTELDRYNRLRIYASSGGLLLCKRSTFSNFIYNPLTGENCSVPEPAERRHSITWDCAVAFHVFDKLRYVLLRVFSSPIKGNLLILKFDSDVGEWRESSHRIPPPHNFSVQLDKAAVFLNGKFHWVSRCGTQVLIHNLEDGSIRIITSPVVPNTHKLFLAFIQMVILGEYQGKLCYCGMDMKSECFTMWVLDSEDRWLLKNTASMQRMRDEHKQVVGSDDSLVPLLLCFDTGDPGAVYLEWRTSKYDGSRFSNIVRYNMVTARHQFVTKINNRSYSEMIQFCNFIKPSVSE